MRTTSEQIHATIEAYAESCVFHSSSKDEINVVMTSYSDMLLTTNQVTTFTFWWNGDVPEISVLYTTIEEPSTFGAHTYAFPYMTKVKPTTDVLADYDRAMKGI